MTFKYQALDPELSPKAKFWVEQNFENKLEVLKKMVRIPSLAWPGIDKTPLQESAEFIAEQLRLLDMFEVVEISPSAKDGTPAIIARRQGRTGYPHILLYSHHDIQPVGDLKQWKTSPFEPTIIGDRLFGRGASDDKSGIITIMSACEMLRDLEQEINIGITLFIEGEEEIGSPNFNDFLVKNREKLEANLIVVADSGNFDLETPALTTSLRGLVSLQFRVSTLDHPLHSGVFGGVVADATMSLTRILASLHDEKGSVAVKSLMSMPDSPFQLSEDLVKQQAGVLPGVNLIGAGALAARGWSQPAITLIGIDLPTVQQSSNTLQASVVCKISARIAPNEKPKVALGAIKKHILENAPFGSHVEFGESEMGSPYLARDSWASRLAMDCMTEAYHKQSVKMGLGGSIPFISELVDQFPDAEVLVTGVEDPDSRAHSPNESQHLPTLGSAMRTHGLLLLQLNRMTE